MRAEFPGPGSPMLFGVNEFFRPPAMPTVLSPTVVGNELGQVKPGLLADMILVDGNPVANVELLQDASKLLMIMKDGQFHKDPQVASQSQRQIA